MQQVLAHARSWQLVSAITVVVLMLLSTVIAFADDLPTDGGSHLRTALTDPFTNGTAISPPGIFLALFVLSTFLVSRTRWVGVLGIVLLTLLPVVALIASASDSPAIAGPLGVFLSVIAKIVLPLTTLLGMLSLVQLVQQRRGAEHA